MAGTELVAVKYAACAEFDPSSGQCTTVVWVDAPSPIPPLTAEQGAALGGQPFSFGLASSRWC